MIATRDFDIAAKPRALRAERAWVPQTKSDGYCWGQANRAPKYSWSQRALAECFGTAASSSAGWLPAGGTSTRSPARCCRKPAAIWLRPALWKQTERTLGLSAVNSYPPSVWPLRHGGGVRRRTDGSGSTARRR